MSCLHFSSQRPDGGGHPPEELLNWKKKNILHKELSPFMWLSGFNSNHRCIEENAGLKDGAPIDSYESCSPGHMLQKAFADFLRVSLCWLRTCAPTTSYISFMHTIWFDHSSTIKLSECCWSEWIKLSESFQGIYSLFCRCVFFSHSLLNDCDDDDVFCFVPKCISWSWHAIECTWPLRNDIALGLDATIGV